MQLHLGSVFGDSATRPLILAVLDEGTDVGSMVALSDVALGEGADVVEIAEPQASSEVCRELEASGIRWVLMTGSDVVALEALDDGASAIHWVGDAPPGRAVLDAAPEVPFLGGTIDGARPFDWWLGEVGASEGAPTDVIGQRPVLAELGHDRDAARVAARVTVALELGARGFRTRAPRSVRRAAFVVRAIEAAR